MDTRHGKAVSMMDIQRAAGRLERQQVKGCLVGTAALFLRGFKVVPHDIDFLVETVVEAEPGDTFNDHASRDSASLNVVQGGIQVDYIGVGSREAPFFDRNPEIIQGVPVASVPNIIGLKRMADRPQDRAFLSGWDATKP